MQPSKDPTFTPLRNEDGSFLEIQPPEVQVKKDQSDPDFTAINPDILRLCQRNGMARDCLTLYLAGQLTWLAALELIVVALGKELLRNQDIFVEQRNDYIRLLKSNEAPKQIAQTMELDAEAAHKNYFSLPEHA